MRNRWRTKVERRGNSFGAVYTLPSCVDDGIVNTSDALIPGDFRRERSRSLLDRRHRFAFSGTFDTPRKLGHLRFSPILRLASGAPFNISIGGNDRNLDDVGNDRPNFTGDLSTLRWREDGDPIDPAIINSFSLPTIGQSGNLPRNAGLGPGQFLFDLSVSREFRQRKAEAALMVEFDNVLNATVSVSPANSSTQRAESLLYSGAKTSLHRSSWSPRALCGKAGSAGCALRF